VLNPVDDDRWPGKSAAIVLINTRGR
jgi:hypothetical protein